MSADTSNIQPTPFAGDATGNAFAAAPRSSTGQSVHGASRAQVWTGRVLTTLTTLFLLFDVFGKFAKPPKVTDAFVRLGLSVSLSVDIGVILLICTALYAIPRTAVFGALLLTGFLGGAVAIQWRAGTPLFETIFPILFALVAWAGIFLRDARLWSLLPVRRSR
ncbi:MAG TPA: DoxX family protein [Terracidiphilus sp.]|nr:DoxX family protein [Terracidiphilus sp.]